MKKIKDLFSQEMLDWIEKNKNNPEVKKDWHYIVDFGNQKLTTDKFIIIGKEAGFIK